MVGEEIDSDIKRVVGALGLILKYKRRDLKNEPAVAEDIKLLAVGLASKENA